MDIAAFLIAEREKPFIWGETDCVATCDRWIASVTRISPVAALGKAWGSESEALTLLSERGGLPGLAFRAMRKAGFDVTREARPGDAGLVRWNGIVAAALFTGSQWVARNETGFIGAPPNAALRAWRVA